MIITVNNIEFLGKHGVYEEERLEGRRFQVDLSVTVSQNAGAHSDQLAQTVDYRELAQIVLDVGHGPGVNLIEHMAQVILTRILDDHPSVEHAQVHIRKFATGVPGSPSWVGVTLATSRE